ncbi:MAG: GntR family transcriptional regulator [Ligilactobacillus sp.]|uniref:GntR family transcriptional regulator n=1 Tax=Ligilactobacillus equi DPC 6820 TaxID=1392007 RepID=V7HXI5_9LACO|nr:GntR family transcriptional regulator [Ligilactobacillus equi]ETA73903.1 GntR family transcriptional regulator [Ligilactobacillus equi DPC 6820]MCQ2557345.1 GntR family transcriptional regulator [Ligilactobacillus sp.]
MGTPRYIKIHNEIQSRIEKGYWQVGQRIPAERELAQEFMVSRMTLRQALQTLVDEGILERRIGAGTFVAQRRIQDKMSGITSFTELTRRQGKVPSSQTVSYLVTEPSLSEAEKLELAENQKILRMERIRFADDEPICFEVAALPFDMVADYRQSQVTTSLYQTLADDGLRIGRAQQTVSATVASERIAELLKVKRGSAILMLRQVTTLKDGRPFEYVRTHYAGDRFEFYLEK